MDIHPHTPFIVFLASFSSCLIHLWNSTVIGHALEAQKGVNYVTAAKRDAVLSRKSRSTAKKPDRLDEDSSQKPNADPNKKDRMTTWAVKNGP